MQSTLTAMWTRAYGASEHIVWIALHDSGELKQWPGWQGGWRMLKTIFFLILFLHFAII